MCNTRKNGSSRGSKSDRIDARKLAEQLYMNNIKSVYHGEQGLRTLKELARSYLTISKDLTRVMNRIKALYRSWAIPCAGKEVYAYVIARNGSPRSRKPACGDAPNTITSSSIPRGIPVSGHRRMVSTGFGSGPPPLSRLFSQGVGWRRIPRVLQPLLLFDAFCACRRAVLMARIAVWVVFST